MDQSSIVTSEPRTEQLVAATQPTAAGSRKGRGLAKAHRIAPHSWLGAGVVGLGVGAALAGGGRKALEDLSLVYRFLGKLTSSQISPRLLGGPIEIAKQAGRSAEEGFSRLLLFLTMLSANLAVVNFLPIPVLDGGHMVFLLY